MGAVVPNDFANLVECNGGGSRCLSTNVYDTLTSLRSTFAVPPADPSMVTLEEAVELCHILAAEQPRDSVGSAIKVVCLHASP